MKSDLLSILPNVQTLSIEDAVHAADLNWQVESEPLGGLDTGRKATGRKGLFTSDDRFLGDVGAGYTPTDPSEFVSSLYGLAGFSGFPVSRLSFMASRSQIVGFIDMKPIEFANEKINVGMIVRDGFDGFTTRSYAITLIREICKNGMVSKTVFGKSSAKHSKNFDIKNDELFKTVTAKMEKNIADLSERFQKLYGLEITPSQVDTVMAKLFPCNAENERSTRSQNTVDDILARFARGIGNKGQTAWDLFNGITEFETHGKTYKQTENQTPDSNRFKAFSDGFSLAEKAQTELLALA